MEDVFGPEFRKLQLGRFFDRFDGRLHDPARIDFLRVAREVSPEGVRKSDSELCVDVNDTNSILNTF